MYKTLRIIDGEALTVAILIIMIMFWETMALGLSISKQLQGYVCIADGSPYVEREQPHA